MSFSVKTTLSSVVSLLSLLRNLVSGESFVSGEVDVVFGDVPPSLGDSAPILGDRLISSWPNAARRLERRRVGDMGECVLVHLDITWDLPLSRCI